MRILTPMVMLSALVLASGARADTTLHIDEVFLGTTPYAVDANTDNTVQYILLRFTGGTSGQDANGWSVTMADASGGDSLALWTFFQPTLNGNDSATLLLMTKAGEDFFGISADIPYSGQQLMPNVGGILCITPPNSPPNTFINCFTWGAYTDAINPAIMPSDNASVSPFNPKGGIIPGYAAQRIQTSNPLNDAEDFWLTRSLWPQNNIGLVGTVPPSVCGNGIVEGLEVCDDGSANGTPNDTCGSNCMLQINACPDPNVQPKCAVCGDGIVESGEECDDHNLVNGDGCSSTCQWESLVSTPAPTCGNDVLEESEQCDYSTGSDSWVVPADNNTCTPTCQLNAGYTPFCGDGYIETGEQCDQGSANGPTGACNANCVLNGSYYTPVCGNSLLDPNELCDQGANNCCPAGASGCTAMPCSGSATQCTTFCRYTTAAYFVCGNGKLEPGEECDDGSSNGQPGDNCTLDCTFVNVPTTTTGGATSTSTTGASSTTTAGAINGLAPTVPSTPPSLEGCNAADLRSVGVLLVLLALYNLGRRQTRRA